MPIAGEKNTSKSCNSHFGITPPRANYMKLKVKPCNLKQFLKLYIDQKTANFSPSLNFKIMTVYCILHVYFTG